MSFVLTHQDSKNKKADNKAWTAHFKTPSHHSRMLPEKSVDPFTSLQRSIDSQVLQEFTGSNVSSFDFAKIGILPPKMKVNRSGDDDYEQEAESVAERVTRMRQQSNLRCFIRIQLILLGLSMLSMLTFPLLKKDNFRKM
jgi:hypothetical protein